MHLESRAYRQMAKKSEKKYRMLLPQKEVKYTCIRSIDSNSIWIWTRGKPSFTDASCVYYPAWRTPRTIYELGLKRVTIFVSIDYMHNRENTPLRTRKFSGSPITRFPMPCWLCSSSSVSSSLPLLSISSTKLLTVWTSAKMTQSLNQLFRWLHIIPLSGGLS